MLLIRRVFVLWFLLAALAYETMLVIVSLQELCNNQHFSFAWGFSSLVAAIMAAVIVANTYLLRGVVRAVIKVWRGAPDSRRSLPDPKRGTPSGLPVGILESEH